MGRKDKALDARAILARAFGTNKPTVRAGYCCVFDCRVLTADPCPKSARPDGPDPKLLSVDLRFSPGGLHGVCCRYRYKFGYLSGEGSSASVSAGRTAEIAAILWTMPCSSVVVVLACLTNAWTADREEKKARDKVKSQPPQPPLAIRELQGNT